MAMEIRRISPREKTANEYIRQLDRFQASLYPPQSNHLDDLETLIRPNVFFAGAFKGNELRGIGAVKRLRGYGEIKRMFVPETFRGQGIGEIIIQALEKHLRKNQIFLIRLETGIKQIPAIRLYEKMGYMARPPFGTYEPDPLSVFMEKQLN